MNQNIYASNIYALCKNLQEKYILLLSHFPHVLCGIYSVRVGAQRVKRLVC